MVLFSSMALYAVEQNASVPYGVPASAAAGSAQLHHTEIEAKELRTKARLAEAGTPYIQQGLASWYGEAHRGKLMANGQRFDPDKLTAASWFYPLGSRVRVILKTDPHVLNPQPPRSVWVTITDRGPHRRLVRDGRIIDLSYGVFRRLADPDLGLVEVLVHPEVRPQQLAARSPG